MCTCNTQKNSPVLERCFEEGYTTCYRFEGSELVQQDDGGNCYSILLVNPRPRVCTDAEIIVYVFQTPDGKPGHSVLSFYHHQDDLQ